MLNREMRQWLAAGAASLSILFAGCGSNEPDSNRVAPTAPQQANASGGTAEAAPIPYAAPRQPGDMLPADFSPEFRSGVTLVFFSQVGCESCAEQTPIYERAVTKLPAGARSIQVYPHMVSPEPYGVTDYPTLIVFRDGRPAKRLKGVNGEQKILAAVRSAQNP